MDESQAELVVQIFDLVNFVSQSILLAADLRKSQKNKEVWTAWIKSQKIKTTIRIINTEEISGATYLYWLVNDTYSMLKFCVQIL